MLHMFVGFEAIGLIKLLYLLYRIRHWLSCRYVIYIHIYINKSRYYCFVASTSSFNFDHMIFLQKVANEKEALVAVKASEPDAALDPPSDSHPTRNTIHRDERRLTEDKESVDLSLQGSQVTDSQNLTLQDVSYDPEKIRQEKAATKAQAVFRGYLVIFSFVDDFWDTCHIPGCMRFCLYQLNTPLKIYILGLLQLFLSP